MAEFFDNLLSRQYAPHGYCFFWQPELLWTHVIADSLIAAAYFSIPLALIHFVRRRPDVQFGWILWLFAAFILACGATHVMAIWTLWNPDYGLEGLAKAFTAAVSLAAAISLWFLIPRALTIPSPAQLQAANDALRQRVEERDNALDRLQQEVTQRQEAEAALAQAQKIEAVGQLTGGIAHDFNNLLQVIAGTLELIGKNSGQKEKIARWADRALEATRKGTALTSQLLAFSRVQKLALQPLDVSPMISGMLDLLTRTLGPSITIATSLEENEQAVLTDANQLELAILNLAINARDAMPDGGRLSISTQSRVIEEDLELEPGQYIDIVVTDTGTGMTREVLSRAIEPFFTTKEVGKGTGLGLSMVYGIARQSGGKVSISSSPGHGTAVTITLRQCARPAATAMAAKGPKVAPAGPSSPHKANVMVIDDDAAVREVIIELLQASGHRTSAYQDGRTGLAALKAIRPDLLPDLLIVDFAMPDMNGAEVAIQAAALHPSLRILFASGYSDTAAIETAAGASARILRKPFTRDDLEQEVAKALARSA